MFQSLGSAMCLWDAQQSSVNNCKKIVKIILLILINIQVTFVPLYLPLYILYFVFSSGITGPGSMYDTEAEHCRIFQYTHGEEVNPIDLSFYPARGLLPGLILCLFDL